MCLRTCRIKRWLLLFSVALLVSQSVCADESLEVIILDPFVDLHTGPGRGYPITQVIERGESTTLLKRRTDWIKVRHPRGGTGWVHRGNLQLTLGKDDRLVELRDAGIDAFVQRRWSGGFTVGDFGGAESLSAHLAYRFSHNLSVEGKFAQAIGQFSDSTIAGISLQHEVWPQWRVSPFFSLGVGLIETSPDATLVQSQDRSDGMMMVGVGAQGYLSRQFVMRLEYVNNLILTSRNENEEVNEWKLGFNVFF